MFPNIKPYLPQYFMVRKVLGLYGRGQLLKGHPGGSWTNPDPWVDLEASLRNFLLASQDGIYHWNSLCHWHKEDCFAFDIFKWCEKKP